MNSSIIKTIILIIIILILLSRLSENTFGQSSANGNSYEKVRTQLAELLRYADANASQEETNKLAELLMKATQDGLKFEERRDLFTKIFVEYTKLKGFDFSDRTQMFSGLAAFAATNFQNGGKLDLSLPEPRGDITGDYIHVETHGSGSTQMLLIGDGGIDARELYKSFIERNSKFYTMHIVTLPGAGLAKPQPYPQKMDYISRPWVGNVEQSLERLIDNKFGKKKEKIVVIGTAVGGYFAAKLALTKPEKIRAVVLVDALVNIPTRSTSSPDAPATLEERLDSFKRFIPFQFFPQGEIPDRDSIIRILNDPKSTHPTVRNYMAFATKDEELSKLWTTEALAGGFYQRGIRMGLELRTTDLTKDLEKLSVPMLAMCALHDDKSPRATTSGITQWEEIKLLYPSIPLTVVTFDDTRSYINVERPEDFDRAVSDFLASKQVKGYVSNQMPVRQNPRAAVTQVVGSTEIRISYGRIAAKEQSIQKLIPNNRIWSIGADEAATISFSRDVVIEGQKLSAGTYTVFAMPNEKEWTVIFNNIKRQWGASGYNPAFDALRVKVQPQQTEHQNWLTIDFEPASQKSAKIVLRWEKLSISFNLEAS